MMLKDFPADDMAKWKQLMQNGKYMLTEAEPAMDAASAMRFGRDVFVQLDHVRNWEPCSHGNENLGILTQNWL